VANLNHFLRQTPGAHLSFSAIALKVLRVKPKVPILQGILAGTEHSRCLQKSFANLEFRQEALISFYVLASLRKQKPSPKQTVPKFACI
jgi:hypothetical protein